jgi:ferric iron reductase protein FhuF
VRDAVTAALQQAARIGPYFTTEDVRGPGWSPLAALLGNATVNGDIVAATRRDLAQRQHARPSSIEVRVAASIHFLDIAARVISPVLATAVLADTVPALTPRNIWWRRRRSGALSIGMTAFRAEPPGEPDDAAERLRKHLVEPVVLPLARAYRQRFGLAEPLLWGNVASAVVGAAGQLAAHRPTVTTRLDRIVAALLGAAPLAPAVLQLPPEFVRNSCCLFYRLPEGSLCGDCVLRVRRDTA